MNTHKIIVGPPDAPILSFYNEDILEIRETSSVSMVGAELAIDQFVPTVKYDLIIRYVLVPKDIEFYQQFVTADGFVLTGKYNYDVRAIPYGTQVRLYVDDRVKALYYLNKVDRLSRNTFKLSCFSAIGLMDKQRHVGGVYSGERVDALVAEIIGTEYEYAIDPEVGEQQVFGWLPYGTKRSSLHQLLLGYGINLTKSDSGGMLFTFLKAVESIEIPTERIYNEGSVVYGEAASRVELLEHGYYYLPSVAEETLYDTRGERVENAVIVFPQPIYSESIRVEDGGDMMIIESGTNYAIVSGTGVLVGKPYVHTTKRLLATNEEAPTEKVVTVENATLVTLANSENCLKRISEYYFNATTVKNAVMAVDEKTGRRYVFQNPFYETTAAFLASMSTNFSNVAKSECEFIQDYVPIAQGSAFLRREILELTEDGAVWNVPDSVYEKDVPKLRVVLIGAGYDGASGEDGKDGLSGTESDGGSGGEGGKGGLGGQGGKILSMTINVSNLAFLRYGSTGKNTWLSAGSDFYTSASGTSSPTGFVEMFTGAVYALPGSHGIDGAGGGHGGSYPPIAAVGTENTKSAAGGEVEFSGIRHKGGKASSRLIQKGTELAWIHDNLNLYFGGSGGGGAAGGAAGGDAIPAEITASGGTKWEVGGRGADALSAVPTLAMYGCGGNGGSGGGGGGGCGNVHWWNYAYTTLISVDKGDNTPGSGGKGSAGTQGYRGCIIIYY